MLNSRVLVCFALFCTLLISSATWGQRDDKPLGVISATPFDHRGRANLMAFVFDEEVRKLLDITDRQQNRLRKGLIGVRDEFNAELEKLGGSDLDKSEIAAKKKQLQSIFRKKTKLEVRLVLVPLQIERLDQLIIEKTLISLTAPELITRVAQGEEFPMSEVELDRVMEKAKEIQKNLDEEISRLRNRAWHDVFKDLNDNQKHAIRNKLTIPKAGVGTR